jgi:hypothetical protein
MERSVTTHVALRAYVGFSADPDWPCLTNSPMRQFHTASIHDYLKTDKRCLAFILTAAKLKIMVNSVVTKKRVSLQCYLVVHAMLVLFSCTVYLATPMLLKCKSGT